MTPAENQVIAMFQSVAERMRRSPIARPGKVKFTLQLASVVPVKPFEGFSVDDASLYLLPLRQLYMKKETVHFPKVCDLVTRLCDRAHLLPSVERARRLWDAALAGGTFGIHLDNGEKVNNERALKYYLYSGLFHSDADNVALMDSQMPVIRAFVECQAQSCMRELFVAVDLLDDVIREWLTPGTPVEPTTSADLSDALPT